MPIAPAPKAPAVASPAPKAQSTDDDTLMMAGAGGLGIILLAGGGYALMRRKRDEEELETVSYEPEAQTRAAEPLVVAPVAMAPMAAPTEPLAGQSLPEGFDASRYGRHAQAAFRGPTADNPSLSLKHRLKRAAFFDQRERAAMEAGTMPKVATAAARSPDTITRPAPAEQIVYRPQRVAKTGFRPAFRTSPAR